MKSLRSALLLRDRHSLLIQSAMTAKIDVAVVVHTYAHKTDVQCWKTRTKTVAGCLETAVAVAVAVALHAGSEGHACGAAASYALVLTVAEAAAVAWLRKKPAEEESVVALHAAEPKRVAR